MGTYGSEPHMPFGGFGDSGNGTREPGLEALDVYTEIKKYFIFYEKQFEMNKKNKAVALIPARSGSKKNCK